MVGSTAAGVRSGAAKTVKVRCQLQCLGWKLCDISWFIILVGASWDIRMSTKVSDNPGCHKEWKIMRWFIHVYLYVPSGFESKKICPTHQFLRLDNLMSGPLVNKNHALICVFFCDVCAFALRGGAPKLAQCLLCLVRYAVAI